MSIGKQWFGKPIPTEMDMQQQKRTVGNGISYVIHAEVI
jgi:hypothetical protein